LADIPSTARSPKVSHQSKLYK